MLLLLVFQREVYAQHLLYDAVQDAAYARDAVRLLFHRRQRPLRVFSPVALRVAPEHGR